jgi:predicted nucleic acid-binding protein
LRIAVIDSAPLIGLVHLELAKELSLFFDRIYVPRTVQVEVNRKHRFRYHLRKLYETGIFERCACVDKVAVELLTPDVDEGEAEGLVQAQEKNAGFFIGDEKRARQIAEAQGLKPVGTTRILARLNLEGRAEKTDSLVKRLRADLRFRVADRIVQEAIARAPEPI